MLKVSLKSYLIGVHDVQYTEQILLEQLENCVPLIEKAERYELLGPLYRLIIPMYEKRRNYHALSQCYENLATAYSKIAEVNKTGKRLLGRYYRVAFFGSVSIKLSYLTLRLRSIKHRFVINFHR